MVYSGRPIDITPCPPPPPLLHPHTAEFGAFKGSLYFSGAAPTEHAVWAGMALRDCERDLDLV